MRHAYIERMQSFVVERKGRKLFLAMLIDGARVLVPLSKDDAQVLLKSLATELGQV